jgi:hypothetical protein
VSSQLAFESIEQEAAQAAHGAALAYLQAHRARYLDYAQAIEPDRRDWRAIWDRLAFAILSANTTVNLAVQALRRLRAFRGHAPRVSIPGIVPAKIDFLNALPRTDIRELLRQPKESWGSYRSRLTAVPGLALTKASYAACLLYPLTADVACLDLWVQRFLTGVVQPSPPAVRYLALEDQIRREFARPARVSVALAQWAIWDYARTRRPTPQRFFD